MKIRRSSSQSGSVLLATVLACMVIGITLGSYLQYTTTQSRSIARSQLWNSAIPIAEAGVEEALAHLNSCTTTNYAVNGWTRVGDEYQKSNKIGNVPYFVRIDTNKLPVIRTTAYAVDPRTGVEYSRTIRVSTSRWSTGAKGLVAKNDVTMVGGGTRVDSFDSEDPRYSTNGRYDSTKAKDGGYVASVSGNITATTILGTIGTGPNGEATGTVGDAAWVAANTGIQPGAWQKDVNYSFPNAEVPWAGGAASPSSGTFTLTNYTYWSSTVTSLSVPNPMPAGGVTTNTSTVTTTSYPTNVAANLVTTNWTPARTKTMPAEGTYRNLTVQGQWKEYDLLTGYNYPSLTFTYSTTTTNATSTAETYTYLLSGDRYESANMSLSGNQKVLVTGTNVTLYIPGDFTMTGNSEFIIAPGASINLFVGGNANLAGNGVFNHTLDASKFRYYGLPTNTSIDIAGNAAFTGVIYAPSAHVQMRGGGNNIYDVVGAIIANSAGLNGHFNFHYDERLGRDQTLSKLTAASWIEM